MTVRRTGSADFNCRSGELAAHVRAVLGSQPRYRKTKEIAPGRVFQTVVKPSWWVMGTRMQISIEEHGQSTAVSCQTTSQWFILGDVFNGYPKLLQDFLNELKRVFDRLGAPPA